MKIICPNCEAEYEIAESRKSAEEILLECSNCNQQWFQCRALSSIIKIDAKNKKISEPKTASLRALAKQESGITFSSNTASMKDPSFDTKLNSKIPDGTPKSAELEIKNRLKDSSNLLQEAKKNLEKIPENKEEKSKREIDFSTILGFVLVTSIFLTLAGIYAKANKISEIFPTSAKYLKQYEATVNSIILSTRNLTSILKSTPK